jgi:hypothetical protein
MTTNKIFCIIFLSIGIILFLTSIYVLTKSIKDKDTDSQIFSICLCIIAILFIPHACIHWHDDNKYKTIQCTSYKIETICTTRNDSVIETKYKIYYK